jgi:hypothetical protein
MKIASLTIELTRADISVAQFLVRVVLDSPIAGCEVKGRVIGPRCPGITTVEVAYPLVLVESKEAAATLKGVIPEPNLWTREAPFDYEVTVTVWEGDRQIDKRASVLALRGQ